MQIRIINDLEVGKILIFDLEVLAVIGTVSSRLPNVEILHHLHQIIITDPLKDNNFETQVITFNDGTIIAITTLRLEIRIHLTLDIHKNETRSFKTQKTQVLDHEITPGITINPINALKGT